MTYPFPKINESLAKYNTNKHLLSLGSSILGISFIYIYIYIYIYTLAYGWDLIIIDVW